MCPGPPCRSNEFLGGRGELQQIVTQYFMTQRIKPTAKEYEKKLAVLHEMLLAAMKCKQTTELAHVNELRSLTRRFEALYFEGQQP